LLKFGRLMLDGGRWRGQQIVPEAWVRELVQPRIDTGIALVSPGDGPAAYGWQWWLGELELRGERVRWVQAVGNGGQRLLLVPELDLSVVLTGGDYGDASIQTWENGVLVQLLETLR
jgi:CubicO group peptidase (beta-lactamase class C family)